MLLIKFSSFPPTKIEELTAGSDEKTQRSPTAVSCSIFVGEEGENLLRNDPDKSELSDYIPRRASFLTILLLKECHGEIHQH